jgi:glycosyltransferase involved in cell wall biosynthesis
LGVKHPQSVLIRSTTGWFEPRFKSAEKYLVELFGSVSPITWSRTVNDDLVEFSDSKNVFKIKAGYGRGWRNIFHHIAFFFFVIRRLSTIQPQTIYACDLDALLPSLIWRLNRNCIIIYDQFDPLSARTKNNTLRSLMNKFEYKLSGMSDIRITANRLRIPRELRGPWFEIKNLFPIEVPTTSSNSNSPLVLFYGGVLSIDRGLLACAEAISKEQDWELHVYGQGELFETLTCRNFRRVFIHQSVPHDELMTLASKSHLFLAMYDPSLAHNKLTASNKLFEAAQLGLPILTNDGTSVGYFTVNANLGWSVTYNDVEEIRRVLREFSKTSQVTRKNLEMNLRSFYTSQKIENDTELDRIRIRLKALLGGAI